MDAALPWFRAGFDAMIVPPASSRLRGATSETVLALPLHRMMITHPSAIAAIADRLGAR